MSCSTGLRSKVCQKTARGSRPEGREKEREVSEIFDERKGVKVLRARRELFCRCGCSAKRERSFVVEFCVAWEVAVRNEDATCYI